MKELQNEIFVPVPIPGYENCEISNKGHLRRAIKTDAGVEYVYPKATINTRSHHLQYNLIGEDGRMRTVMAHSLVARAFIPNPERHANVIHLDGNSANLNVENLRWVSHAEAMEHAFTLRYKPVQTEKKTKAKYVQAHCPACGAITYEPGHLCVACAQEKAAANIPSKEDVIDLLVKHNANLSAIGREKGVSDNTVRKWCKKYGIDFKAYK